MDRRAPAGIVALLLGALGAQCALHALLAAPAAPAPALPAAPTAMALRLASLGDGPAAARLVMLYLHAFDAGIPLRALDYDHVAGWLEGALALDPRSRQPLVAAAQVYGAVARSSSRSRLSRKRISLASVIVPSLSSAPATARALSSSLMSCRTN
ncbi:MAG TPA: hypothetical protein VF774_06110, partial [Pseudoduganella sp.]